MIFTVKVIQEILMIISLCYVTKTGLQFMLSKSENQKTLKWFVKRMGCVYAFYGVGMIITHVLKGIKF